MRKVIRITPYLGKDRVRQHLDAAQEPWRGVGDPGEAPDAPARYHKRAPDEFGRLLKNVTISRTSPSQRPNTDM